MKENINIFFIAMTMCIILSPSIFAQKKTEIRYTFSQSDSTYSFYGCFITQADAACIIHTCFDFEHNRTLSIHAREVSLIEQGEHWNKIRYTYAAFYVFRTESVWYRTLDTLQKRIDFSLLTNRSNSRLIPKIHSSRGYYRIKSQENGNLMEYYQQFCLSETILTTKYKDNLKKEAIAFLKLLSDYVNRFCQSK